MELRHSRDGSCRDGSCLIQRKHSVWGAHPIVTLLLNASGPVTQVLLPKPCRSLEDFSLETLAAKDHTGARICLLNYGYQNWQQGNLMPMKVLGRRGHFWEGWPSEEKMPVKNCAQAGEMAWQLQSTSCFQKTRIKSQDPHGSTQPFVTPVREMKPSHDLHGHCMHMVHTHNSYTCKRKWMKSKIK